MNARETFLEDEWRNMRRRIVASIAANQSEVTESVLSVPVSNYTDVSRFEAEKRILFRETPLLAGFSLELEKPGSVMLFDGAGPGIFIVRRDDGSLNAWLNVCPHRGARIVHDCTPKQVFSCPFHSWSFGADGKLFRMPQSHCFEGAENVDLTPIPVAEKYGLIFIRATPNGAPIDLDEFLGPMAPLLESFGLGQAAPVGKDSYVVETNWKIALDTGCEGYHVPATHARSLAPQMTPFITIQDSFGLHHRYCGPEKTHMLAVGKAEADWPATQYGAAHYIFPNIVFSYTQAIDANSVPVLALLRLFPGKHPGEALVVHNLYKPADAAAQDDAAFVALHQAIIAINQNEDLTVAHDVWENYRQMDPESRITFGRNELVLQRYHQQIAELIGMPIT